MFIFFAGVPLSIVKDPQFFLFGQFSEFAEGGGDDGAENNRSPDEVQPNQHNRDNRQCAVQNIVGVGGD